MRSNERATRVRGLHKDSPRFQTRVEPLETRALLATLFVNAANTTGIEDGSQAHPFSHIQAAIDLSAPTGDIIKVAAGTYAESLKITHSLELLGPNAGIDPNSGQRGPEAIVVPPVDAPDGGDIILVTGSAVTIDGLTLDGHNPNLATGGVLLNGVSSNAASGISNVSTAGTLAAISGLTVQNNVIKDLTKFGVIADVNDFSTGTAFVSTGNAIRNNRIDNIPTVTPTPGRGISIEDNFYADVTGNVITRAATGIQAIFSLDASPTGATSTISNNEVHEYNLGIYLWTLDSGVAPAYNVSSNQVFAEAGATPTNAGISLDRVLHSTGVTVANNNVTGAHIGIGLNYVPTTATINVSGGTLSHNDIGVLLTNADVPTADVPPKAVQASLTGVTIVGSKVAGIEVDDTLAVVAAPVTLGVDAATTVTGSTHGAVLTGANSKLVDAGIPVVTFTSTPPAQATGTTATFGVSARDNVTSTADLVVRYSLDGAPLAPAAATLNLSGLTIGTHTLLVQATDQAGNVGKATYQWTVATAPAPPPTPSPAPTVTIAPSTYILLPSSKPNAVVTISGKIGSKLPVSATYSVVDSDGKAALSGAVTIGADGSYSFPLTLPTTMNGNPFGRLYTILIQVKDSAGKATTARTFVFVPNLPFLGYGLQDGGSLVVGKSFGQSFFD